jgi:hypothetical protein
MENPKIVLKFLGWLLITVLTVTIALSIINNDFKPILWFGYAVLGIVIVCSLVTIVNIIIYTPLLLIISKLFSKKNDNKT